MERSECMRTFLLLVFISAVHLSPDPELKFGTKGKHAELRDFWWADEMGVLDLLLYRIDKHGDQLLFNCSQLDRPQPDDYNITCLRDRDEEIWGFELNHLTLSQSGDYRVEGRKRGLSSPVRSIVYRLTVCAEDWNKEDGHLYVRDGSAVLCGSDFNLGKDSSLQLYEYRDWRLHTLVLDTSSSLEPLQPDLEYRLQVDTNTSTITLTEFTFSEPIYKFLCTMWRGGQCQRFQEQLLVFLPAVVVTHEEENVSLPCTFRQYFPNQVYWETPTGDVRISSNQTRPQEVMYMLNGSQSGDYSLIIPNVSHQHAGIYSCRHSNTIFIPGIILSVCFELPPVNVMFSHGESVLMNAHVNETMDWVQWFHQKGQHPQVLIIDYKDKNFAPLFGINDVRMPEDLMGRVTAFNSSTSLNISNLTAENSGVYTWRVIKRMHINRNESRLVCHEGSIRLVYRDPFGVHTPFYRAYGPLLGCVLLGLVAVVTWLKLRSRGGALTPAGQEMEMQDIGDDVYDDVEEAEDSV